MQSNGIQSGIKTLLIDNYDSFTYNLFQLISLINGQEPLVVKNDITWQTLQDLYVNQDFNNLIISPGPGNPQNPGDCGIAYKAVKECKIPILGVCLGCQMIGHYFGANIITAPELFHGRTSIVKHHNNDPLFADIPEAFTAVRYHSLILAQPLPEVTTETAYTDDDKTGNKVIMAIKHQALPIWGVQFHPESILSEYGNQLLINFKRITVHYLNDRK